MEKNSFAAAVYAVDYEQRGVETLGGVAFDVVICRAGERVPLQGD